MAAAPFEGRLKQIQETKTISVGYRTDALPFSFEDTDKKPAGYTVDMCRGVIAVIERQLGVSPLQVKWVPVTTQTRFSAIASGQADMECGASTVTLGRMKEVAFSSLTFLDGTGLLIRASTTGNSLADLSGKKIGVIAGTSNERALDAALKTNVLSATVVKVEVARGRARAARGQHDRRLRERPRPPPRPGHEGQEPEGPGAARRRLVVRAVCDRLAARRLGDEAGRRRRGWRRSTAATRCPKSTAAGSARWARRAGARKRCSGSAACPSRWAHG
jgi:hypothetical protein